VRVIDEIPHPKFKITIFSWNEKFIVKVEIDRYEQVYKMETGSVSGLDQVKAMIDADFLKRCMVRFVAMREDWTANWKQQTQNTLS